MVLLVECANGLVVWYFRPVGRGEDAQAKCINSNHVVALNAVANGTWLTAFAEIRQHSVSLRGTVQRIVVLPARIT